MTCPTDHCPSFGIKRAACQNVSVNWFHTDFHPPASSRTLTASDRISVLRDLVLSTNDLTLSQRNPRGTDRRDSFGCSSSHIAGPSAVRFDPSDPNIGHPHFGLGKHNKDVTEYCRLAPKRHSSGSSPISTPPSEDSGSETVALTTSPTSGYWDIKNPNRLTTIPSTYGGTTLTQSTCPMCHQCVTRCILPTQVCIPTTATTPQDVTSFVSVSDPLDVVAATQGFSTPVATPTRQQESHSHSSGVEISQSGRLHRPSSCTRCHQTNSHSDCILSTSLGSEHLSCCHSHTGISRSNAVGRCRQSVSPVCREEESTESHTESADLKEFSAANVDGNLRDEGNSTQTHEHSQIKEQPPVESPSNGPGNSFL